MKGNGRVRPRVEVKLRNRAALLHKQARASVPNRLSLAAMTATALDVQSRRELLALKTFKKHRPRATTVTSTAVRFDALCAVFASHDNRIAISQVNDRRADTGDRATCRCQTQRSHEN